MNLRIFNNYMNAVMNAIDAQHNHLDEQSETPLPITESGRFTSLKKSSRTKIKTFAAF